MAATWQIWLYKGGIWSWDVVGVLVAVVVVGDIVVDEDGGDGVVITVVLSNGVAWLQGSVGHLILNHNKE